MFEKLSILGAGLLGASVMQAAKKRGVAKKCVAWSRSACTRELCAKADFCDAVFDTPEAAVVGADCVVACVPVDKIVPLLADCAATISPAALVTDVGSTKAAICADAKKLLPAGVGFVGSHPMAGSELNGFAHGNAELLQNRLCFVANDAEPRLIDLAQKFWQGLGMRTRLVDPAEHDAIVAHVSHLPHAVAAALSAALAQKPAEWRDCGAGGLRDTTRVSAGNPHVWQAILEENRAEIIPALSEFLAKFSELKSALERGDSEALLALLSAASNWRLPLSQN